MKPTHTLRSRPVRVIGPGYKHGCTTTDHRRNPETCVAYVHCDPPTPSHDGTTMYADPEDLVELP